MAGTNREADMSSNARRDGSWLQRRSPTHSIPLISDSISVNRSSKRLVGGGRSVQAPRFNRIVVARSCNHGVEGSVLFP